MSIRANMPRPRSERRNVDTLIHEQLQPILRILAKDPTRLRDNAFMGQAFRLVEQMCGGDELAKSTMMRQLLTYQQQRDKLLAVLKSLREQKPSLGWVLSRQFEASRNGPSRRYVFAAPLGRASLVSEYYQVVEASPDNKGRAKPEGDTDVPDPPFLGVIEPTRKLFLGPADMPRPPLLANIYPVVCSYPHSQFEKLAEIEVTDSEQERTFTVFARVELAKEIKKKLDEDGEVVRVRVESGVATSIHKNEDQKLEDWLEFPPLDGPSVAGLVFPAWLRKEWDRDIRNIALGRSVRVLLIGPTGVGKTSAAERVGCDAVKAAKRMGRRVKGFALIKISSSHIGSSFIHQTERNLFRALKRAKGLAKQGYVVVVLCDEADALLGVMEGGEHSHNRSERLMAQSLLTDPMENGVVIYLTMNVRRNSWLPSAIDRRFLKRVYGRATRSQMEAVAAYYASQHSQAMKKLQMSAAEFAGALVDNLYSDQRQVAIVHFFSGSTLTVWARDLHNCSPAKTKDLIYRFCCDVTDGVVDSVEALWLLLDEEFRVPNLNTRNLCELTFLKLPQDDTVRSVELVR